MTAFKLTLAYDGTNYIGWQRQTSGVSIQAVLEEALRQLEGREVTVVGAGRTDAGVHAAGQVASCVLACGLAPEVLVRAVNARLPADVRVLSARAVADAFHARHDARRKTYRYRIRNAALISPFERRYAWHVAGPLNLQAMAAAALVIEGRHDFAAFQAAGGAARNTERAVVRSHIWARDLSDIAEEDGGPRGGVCIPSLPGQGRLIAYEIAGDGFLRHMVRTIVGTLVEIGRGRWPSERMREVLASRDRACAGPTAPAEGLFLVRVDYGDL